VFALPGGFPRCYAAERRTLGFRTFGPWPPSLEPLDRGFPMKRPSLILARHILLLLCLTGSAARANTNPSILAPATVSGTPGVSLSITGAASDPDGQTVTLCQTNDAPFFPGASCAGPSLNPTITLTGTPSLNEGCPYTIHWTATDTNQPTAGTSTGTTTIAFAGSDRIPVVSAPSTVNGSESSAISVTASATDPDVSCGQLVTLRQGNNAPFLVGPPSVGPSANPSITLSGTPNFSQAGTYAVTWTATDNATPAQSASATTSVVIANVNRNPVIVAPATLSGLENTAISVTASAADPDGQSATLCQTNNAPFFPASSCAGPAFNLSLTLNGTPAAGQAGTYAINWTATDTNSPSAGTAAAMTTVSIAAPPGPLIIAPATVSGVENASFSLTGSAFDPDGQNATLCQTNNAPFFSGSSCSGPSANPTITLAGIPSSNQAGNYTVNWTATDTGTPPLTSTATTSVVIAEANQDPVVTAPSTADVTEDTLITFGASATDPDGDHVALAASVKPFGATFTDNGDNTGTFTWTPDFTAGPGQYVATFVGTDGRGGSGSASTTITVNDMNRPPTADAGGPYEGVVGVPISFDGSGSADPDGFPLAYAWDFDSDGTVDATGPAPAHVYQVPGVPVATLVVTDTGAPPLSAQDTATVTISTAFGGTAFVAGGNTTIHLSSGKPFWCVQIQPPDVTSWAIDQVDLSSIVAEYNDATIHADADKTAIAADKNGDGIAEIKACFTKADLRTLFSGLPAGRTPVTVTIQGDLVTGGKIGVDVQVDVVSNGSFLTASVSPNPLNPEGTLAFRVPTSGRVRIDLYDVQGRLVRSLLEETYIDSGIHDLKIRGVGANGEALASGVYFVRGTFPQGVFTKRIAILK